jgi:hypothetical protein
MGTIDGDPYTAAEDENTNLRIPCFLRVSIIAMPDATLEEKKLPGFVTDSGMSAFAAK